MKNVLIISSTPRKGGNSDVLCDRFAEGAKESGNNVEKIALRDHTINFCTGCGVCNSGRPCPQKDDMAGILDKMAAADIIVMATPVYFYTMSAQMKTLIDRCCGRYTEMNDKEFYFITAAAEDAQERMERTIDTFQGFLDCLNGATVKGVVYGLGVWQVGDIKGNRALEEAYKMGNEIV